MDELIFIGIVLLLLLIKPTTKTNNKTYRQLALQEIINNPENQKFLQDKQKDAEQLNSAITMGLSNFANINTDTPIATTDLDNDEAVKDYYNNVYKEQFRANAISLGEYLGRTALDKLLKGQDIVYITKSQVFKYADLIYFYTDVKGVISQKLTVIRGGIRVSDVFNFLRLAGIDNFNLVDMSGRKITSGTLSAGVYILFSKFELQAGERLSKMLKMFNNYANLNWTGNFGILGNVPMIVLTGSNLYSYVDP